MQELTVVVKAKQLAVYTITKTSNCKKFPKKYRFTLCDKMQTKALQIYEYLFEANQIRDIAERNKRQSRAIILCDELSFYVELCVECKIMSADDSEFWAKSIADVKHLTLAWRSKDK